MNINWKLRLMSPTFWIAFIPAILLLVQVVLVPFGISFAIEPLNSQLLALVDAAFVLLVVLGIVTDHTTKGINDSIQALAYDMPKDDKQIFGIGVEKTDEAGVGEIGKKTDEAGDETGFEAAGEKMDRAEDKTTDEAGDGKEGGSHG